MLLRRVLLQKGVKKQSGGNKQEKYSRNVFNGSNNICNASKTDPVKRKTG